MKKYILEIKGAKVSPEYLESFSNKFEDFIKDDSKSTITMKCPTNAEISIKEINITGNHSSEVRVIKGIDEMKYVKRGFFKRLLSYFI